jgi:predicted nucleotidyltransferase
MRSEYFGSAKITYLDKDAIQKALRSLAARLAGEHPEIVKISVFGSFARDEAAPGSDVDLLLVLKASDLPFPERAGHYRPRRFPIGLDIFAYSADEMRRMLAEGNSFLKRALAEAVTLFERDKP